MYVYAINIRIVCIIWNNFLFINSVFSMLLDTFQKLLKLSCP